MERISELPVASSTLRSMHLSTSLTASFINLHRQLNITLPGNVLHHTCQLKLSFHTTVKTTQIKKNFQTKVSNMFVKSGHIITYEFWRGIQNAFAGFVYLTDADGGCRLCVFGRLCVDMWRLVHQWSFFVVWLSFDVGAVKLSLQPDTSSHCETADTG